MIERVLEQVERDLQGAIGRWSELLRIPSVSTDPAYRPSMTEAATWLVDYLKALDFTAEIRDTAGHPVVVGHHDGPGGNEPHLLYYGHYDVQPPDPAELWDSDPFTPTIVDGDKGPRMVARGAVDNKGQLMTFLEAMRAWKEVHGHLPCPVTVLIEGEEEVGSRNLRPFLEAHREELSADICIVSDTSTWDIDTPALTTRLRGLLYTELVCYGPSHDLHSGFYGGAITNPLNALSQILGSLHDENGRVTLPGFYDSVNEADREECIAWRSLDFDEARFLREAGVSVSGGERGRGLLERLWARPSCDINGLIGGYTGAGAKTVIPSEGRAKISFRLVPDQDPEIIAAELEWFVDQATPPGCQCELEIHSSAPAVRVPTESPYVQAAEAALRSVYGRDPVLIGCGGTIPIVAWVQEILGLDTLLMGFGLEDDRMHSPNEKFELRSFENGVRSHVALLERLRTLAL